MSFLIGQYGIDFIAERSLVYAAALTEVLWKQHPVGGMVILVPGAEVTEVMLVITLNLAAFNMKESCQ